MKREILCLQKSFLNHKLLTFYSYRLKYNIVNLLAKNNLDRSKIMKKVSDICLLIVKVLLQWDT